MPRKSSLHRLPPAILGEVNRLLSEGCATLDEIVAHLRTLGVDSVSRSALGRQKQKIDKVAAKLRQSREVTAGLVRELGPNAKDGEQGRLLAELLRGLVFDHLESRIDEGKELDPKTFQSLSRTARDLSQAIRLDQDFETKIREQVEKEVKARMNQAVERVMGNPGNARLTPDQLRAKMLEAYGGV